MKYVILLFAAIALPPLTDYLVDVQFPKTNMYGYTEAELSGFYEKQLSADEAFVYLYADNGEQAP